MQSTEKKKNVAAVYAFVVYNTNMCEPVRCRVKISHVWRVPAVYTIYTYIRICSCLSGAPFVLYTCVARIKMCPYNTFDLSRRIPKGLLCMGTRWFRRRRRRRCCVDVVRTCRAGRGVYARVYYSVAFTYLYIISRDVIGFVFTENRRTAEQTPCSWFAVFEQIFITFRTCTSYLL